MWGFGTVFLTVGRIPWTRVRPITNYQPLLIININSLQWQISVMIDVYKVELETTVTQNNLNL
jgi:hypothetical protein